MTQDEIEHMWKVASNDPSHDTNWHDPVVIAFAKLVAAKEQKKWEDQTVVEIHEAVLEEREACAKVCDELVNEENSSDYQNAANWCSVRIRARGEQE